MRKVLRKILIVFVCLGCAITFAMPICADDYNFEENEDYYYELCSRTGLSNGEKNTCQLFQQYLTQKAEDLQNDVNEYNRRLEELKKDLSKISSIIAAYDKKIANMDEQIAKVTEQINTIETNIASIQLEIALREERIQSLDEQIQKRMYNIQSFVTLDQYIEFIMGASDFVDLIRRASAVGDIMDYDTGQIALMESEKAELLVNQKELETQKETLDNQKEVLEKTRKSLKKLKNEQVKLQNYYLSQKTELEAQKRSTVDDLDDLMNSLDDITAALGTIAPSAGWIYPVKGGWYISAGAFHYPKSFGGGVHLGVDFAASTSRKIVAPANGVIVYTYNGCSGKGYLGNSCGGVWGGGNMVVMVVQVGSHTYGIQMCHMSQGVKVKAGDVVTQGTVLGNVGSTGNVTGAHLHIEIYDLGTKSLKSAVNTFAKNRDVTFGTGWYTLNTTCSNHATPCRMNPLSVFNVKVGQSAN